MPELDDIVARGYASRDEVASIAAARRDHEYKLKRPSPLLADFLAYAAHEASVDAFIRLRRIAAGGKPNAAASLADRGARRRVHFIYERAARKFRGDLSVWTAWLAFCATTRADRAAARVAARALALHPRVPGLWATAAAWAYGRGRDPAAARALLQRGLRACGGDDALWAEYVRLEARYAVALRARRAVLGLEKAEAEGSGDDASDDDDDDDGAAASASDGDDDALPDPVTAEPAPTTDDDTDAATQAVLDGAAMAAAARGALGARPTSVPLRARLLAVLAEVADVLPSAASTADAVYASLGEGELATDAAAAALGARRALTPFARPGAAGPGAALAAFDKAAADLPTEAMFDEWLAYAREARECGGDGAAAAPPPPRPRAKRAKQAPSPTSPSALDATIETLCERAASAGAASETVLLEWPRAALQRGRPDAALAAAAAACDARPTSAPVWRARLALVAAAPGAAGGDVSVLSVARAAAAALPRAAAWPVLADALAAASAAQDDTTVRDLCDDVAAAQRAGPAGPPRGGAGAAAAAAVRAATASGGAAARRALVAALHAGPSPGGDYWEAVLAAEEEETDEPLPCADRTTLFERATAASPADARPWLRYLAFVRASGDGGGQLAWRAAKALTDVNAAAAFDKGARADVEAAAVEA